MFNELARDSEKKKDPLENSGLGHK